MEQNLNEQHNMYDDVFLETPINDIKEDVFGINPYAEQLYFAIKKGARFIAVDGKHGSGKSSLINMTKNLIKNTEKRRKFVKQKDFFVNINFLNINETSPYTIKKILEKEKEEYTEPKQIENDESSKKMSLDRIKEKNENCILTDEINIVDKYHRYFVNQVANDLYKNPYSVERLFYNNFITYSTSGLKSHQKYKIIIDKLLLVLISFVSLYLLYSGLFKSFVQFNGLYDFATKIIPYVLFLILVLIILYGYGFYKPTKTELSPMLEIDKCRNNLCKVLFNLIPKGSNVYFIIDDLDRIEEKLQLPIISLLYNEYYPLDQVINNINLKFIFMIDINKLNASDNTINANKLFDYIINVSNNQTVILRSYIERMIQNNKTLTEIFSELKSTDYIIGLIVNYYSKIRDIKHLLNRMIMKYAYLRSQKYENINREQLLIISVLAGLEDIDKLNEILDIIVNQPSHQILDNGSVSYKIINEAFGKKLIDNNYYIYLYNFIDVNDLLNPNEQFIYNIANKVYYSKEDDWIKAYKIMDYEDISFSKLYNQIYKYLSNDGKLLMLGNSKFCHYVNVTYSLQDIVVKDIYKNRFIHLSFSNIYNEDESLFFFEGEKETLDNYYHEYIEKVEGEDLEEKEKLISELKKFITSMKWNIKYFNLSEILDSISIEKDLFDLLYNQKINEVSVVFEMILKGNLKWTSIKDFINDNIINDILNIKEAEFRINIEENILNEGFSFKIMLDIICREREKFSNINLYLKNLNIMENKIIGLEELFEIIKKYDYNELLDKHIIYHLDANSKKVVNFFKKYELKLSKKILDKLNSISVVYSYNKFYNDLFLKEKYYKLYIYSKAMELHSFTVEKKLIKKKGYLDGIIEIYICMDISFRNYEFTDDYRKVILENLVLNNIIFSENDFWKILILIPEINNYSIAIKFFNRIKELDLLSLFCKYCLHECRNLKFLEMLSIYVSEFGDKVDKSIVTRTKNKLKKELV